MYYINNFSIKFFKVDSQQKRIEVNELAVLGSRANSIFIDEKGRLHVRRIIDNFNVWSKTFEKNHKYEILIQVVGAGNLQPRAIRYEVIFNRYNPVVCLDTYIGIDKHLNQNIKFAQEELIFTIKNVEVLNA